MTERNPISDPSKPPEDVASLYSWANLHGAKYRDFSASRAQMREKARQRMEQAIEDERLDARRQVEAQRTEQDQRAQEAQQAQEAERFRVAEEKLHAEAAAQQAARQAAEKTAQEAAREAAQQAAQELARLTARQQAEAAQWAAQQAEQTARQAQQAARQASTEPDSAPASTSIPSQTEPSHREDLAAAFSRVASLPVSRLAPAAHAPLREASPEPYPSSDMRTDAHENANRPAWLMPEQVEAASQPALPPAPPAPEDTLQGSRDRMATRWYALRSLFDSNAQSAPTPAPASTRAPVLAIFSLAGGVGKTSLVATLGRALSARGERVLLVDTAAYGLLPFFFGAHDQRPGLLRTFNPPVTSGDAPIQMIALDPESLGPDVVAQETLTAEISKYAQGLSRVIVDLATASGATSRRVLKLAPQVLVPLVPDMNSVVSVSSIDAFFEHNLGSAGKPALPYYVLNQFDPSLPLHLDVREVLREQLGDRLLSFALRHTPTVSEALAEGMTVVDYAPNSTVVDDYASLAGWVKSLSAPASSSFRGVRWSER